MSGTYQSYQGGWIIPVAGNDKHGPKFTISSVHEWVKKAILIDDYFHKRGKRMSDDIKKATEITDTATEQMRLSLNRFYALEAEFGERSKKITGKIRDASTRLADGIARVEKAAALPQLEKHCALLENMADSLERLARMEAAGTLAKISSALK